MSFPGGAVIKDVIKNVPENAGNIRDADFPGSGRSPGGGHGNLLWYSCLENPMDRGTWWATVHRVAKSSTLRKQLSTHIGSTVYKDYLNNWMIDYLINHLLIVLNAYNYPKSNMPMDYPPCP